MGVLAHFLVAVGVILAPMAIESVIYKSFTWLYIYKEGIQIHVPFRPDQFLELRQITQVRSSLWGGTLVLVYALGRIKARVYADLKKGAHTP